MPPTKDSLEDYFSEQAVIEVLCRLRLKQSKLRHDALFQRRISNKAPKPRDVSEFNSYFPARRLWHKYRPEKRGLHSNEDLYFTALKKAVKKQRLINPTAPWVKKLTELVEFIRSKAMQDAGHAFSEPRITAQLKSGNEYRPIACFQNTADRVIDSISAKYLREKVDGAFEPCSVAFRPRQINNIKLDRETAVTAIHEFRMKNQDASLTVAECDIRGFFDCVSHQMALDRLYSAINHAKARNSKIKVDDRAIATFKHYLACYSFSRTVKGDEARLRTELKNPDAYYKWPESGKNSLAEYYDDPKGAEGIGVPQGGALSCLISNLMLDYADKEVCLAAQATGEEVKYFRYCDDMLILAKSEEACRKTFSAYLAALAHLKLPYHEPKGWTYGVEFYENSKTKAPYNWHGRRWFNNSPWIQFLGYQIRYDGLLRIRKKSIEKHKDKLAEITSQLMGGVSIEHSKVNRNRLLHRLHHKLIAISVGRITLSNIINGPKPKCWAAGFSGLHNRPYIGHSLRTFDRLRADAKRELGRRTKGLLLNDLSASEEASSSSHETSYYGYPYSYEQQLQNAGGQKLIFAPYRTTKLDDLVLTRCYKCWMRGKSKSTQATSI